VDAATVQLEVHDSGPGIDPKHAARLFEAFYTTKPDEMGMGLSISRSIIEAHGGRISAACGAGALGQQSAACFLGKNPAAAATSRQPAQ